MEDVLFYNTICISYLEIILMSSIAKLLFCRTVEAME